MLIIQLSNAIQVFLVCRLFFIGIVVLAANFLSAKASTSRAGHRPWDETKFFIVNDNFVNNNISLQEIVSQQKYLVEKIFSSTGRNFSGIKTILIRPMVVGAKVKACGNIVPCFKTKIKTTGRRFKIFGTMPSPMDKWFVMALVNVGEWFLFIALYCRALCLLLIRQTERNMFLSSSQLGHIYYTLLDNLHWPPNK